jgi:hypothetical protein
MAGRCVTTYSRPLGKCASVFPSFPFLSLWLSRRWFNVAVSTLVAEQPVSEIRRRWSLVAKAPQFIVPPVCPARALFSARSLDVGWIR